MNIKQNRLIELYLTYNEEQIEQSIGRILLSYDGKPIQAESNKEKLHERIEAYLDEKHIIFRKIICEDWGLDGKMQSNAYYSNVELVAAITDLIAPYVGVPPAAIVATLIFKRGLKTLCEPSIGQKND
jgi:hypothetical protein